MLLKINEVFTAAVYSSIEAKPGYNMAQATMPAKQEPVN